MSDLVASERFCDKLVLSLSEQIGKTSFTEKQRELGKHLFIKADNSLKEFESKRMNKAQAAYVWNNVDINKMAVDSIKFIKLGLDPLADNFMHTIPYYNAKKGKYDLDLRMGFMAKLYQKKKYAFGNIIDIRIELIYENDKFEIYKKDIHNKIEAYSFKIDPFERGKVKGGFGYIAYDNPELNKIIIVKKEEFDKARGHAKSSKFWNDFYENMCLKTVVHRVTAQIDIDPEKVDSTYKALEEIPDEFDEKEDEVIENIDFETIEDSPFEEENV